MQNDFICCIKDRSKTEFKCFKEFGMRANEMKIQAIKSIAVSI